jgi:hypothetical protein
MSMGLQSRTGKIARATNTQLSQSWRLEEMVGNDGVAPGS